MAYISTQEVAAIRKELKKEFPEYKFSVTKRHHHEVVVKLMKGPAFEVFTQWMKGEDRVININEETSINHYHTDWYGKYQGFFDKIVEIIKTAPFKAGVGDLWFDDSDSQTDYFHTAYYMTVGVGKWDTPYQAV